MGRGTSGSVRQLSNDGGGEIPLDDKDEIIQNDESISQIQNDNLRKDIQQGISKFESRLKLKTRSVQIAEFGGRFENAAGLALTNASTGEVKVYLSSKYFKNGTVNSVSKLMRSSYDANWSVRTNKPTQHIVVHELAHALWTDKNPRKNSVKARKAMSNLFGRYKKAYARGELRNFGKYSTKNVNEFFAEVVTKGVIGNSDKWTDSVFNIIDKYNIKL